MPFCPMEIFPTVETPPWGVSTVDNPTSRDVEGRRLTFPERAQRDSGRGLAGAGVPLSGLLKRCPVSREAAQAQRCFASPESRALQASQAVPATPASRDNTSRSG